MIFHFQHHQFAPRQAPGAWQLELVEDAPAKPCRQVVAPPAEPAAVQVLGFTLDEVREARLAPIVDFRGRRRASADNRLRVRRQ